MGKIVFRIDDSKATAKLKLLQSAIDNPQPVYATVGRVLVNRIRLCFKLGIDPWGNPWQALKFRKGQPLRDAVNKYHKRAEGKSLIDYAFHVILSDASEKIMGQDFTALVADGYTSFKVYMTYDDVKLTDREMLDYYGDADTRRDSMIAGLYVIPFACIAFIWRYVRYQSLRVVNESKLQTYIEPPNPCDFRIGATTVA